MNNDIGQFRSHLKANFGINIRSRGGMHGRTCEFFMNKSDLILQWLKSENVITHNEHTGYKLYLDTLNSTLKTITRIHITTDYMPIIWMRTRKKEKGGRKQKEREREGRQNKNEKAVKVRGVAGGEWRGVAQRVSEDSGSEEKGMTSMSFSLNIK